MRNRLLYLLFAGLLFLLSSPLHAQKWGVKTNVLYDATSTLNVGFELGLAPRWTLDVSGNYNPWTFSENQKLKHWMLQPEGRYWLCESFNGHFFSVHALGGEFNVSDPFFPLNLFDEVEERRLQGWMVGGGLGYGYQWLLGKRWSLEAEIGLGFIHADYDRYECAHCGELLGHDHKNYLGVTKAALSIIYIIK